MHVLVVDDEVIIRNGIKHMISTYRKPFSSIRLAENGEQALQFIADAAPQLVITDIRMPKMDGLELCKQLYEKYPYITIVVISGFAEFEYAQKCMSYGVKNYLLKPVIKQDMHELLDKLLVELEKGVVEPTQVKRWMDEIVEQIWQLQLDTATGSIDGWLDYCTAKTGTPGQLKILLSDFYAGVIEQLQVKGHQSSLIEAALTGGSFDQLRGSFQRSLLELAKEIMQRRGGYKDVMDEAREYIEQHLSREVTLEEVAQHVGLTPNYFSMYFKKTMGVTFIHYRMNKRMELAEQLLAQPHYRIVDIAHEVGYEDYSHFAKTFRKVKGLSPTEYRARLGIK
ncbi:response regulator transcription factor [Paenibacillus sp. GXUN7292]|uniref:response regulator transcription factor n=1 Tax=Paenibacillus sp. GXUN7292 TaxID=3422499 RepID=UPI003D7E8CCE